MYFNEFVDVNSRLKPATAAAHNIIIHNYYIIMLLLLLQYHVYIYIYIYSLVQKTMETVFFSTADNDLQ